MKNLITSLTLLAAALLLSTSPALAQGFGQSGFVPLNQLRTPGMANAPDFIHRAPVNPWQQPQQPMQSFQSQAQVPMGVPGQAYNTSNLNALSPYQQQEMAIKEAKMLQELEDLKNKRELDHGYQNFEKGQVAKSAKKGKFMRAMGKVGHLVKRGAVAAAPAGAAVGTLFIMRAAFGPPATFMPVATPGGTAFVPVSGR